MVLVDVGVYFILLSVDELVWVEDCFQLGVWQYVVGDVDGVIGVVIYCGGCVLYVQFVYQFVVGYQCCFGCGCECFGWCYCVVVEVLFMFLQCGQWVGGVEDCCGLVWVLWCDDCYQDVLYLYVVIGQQWLGGGLQFVVVWIFGVGEYVDDVFGVGGVFGDVVCFVECGLGGFIQYWCGGGFQSVVGEVVVGVVVE